LHEAKVGDVGDEVEKPFVRGLTKTIEGTTKEAHDVRASRILKADRLTAVHCFLQVAVQLHVGDIQLVHRPPPGRYQGEHRLDSGWLDDRGESFTEVDP
jgi:hypothetical protein